MNIQGLNNIFLDSILHFEPLKEKLKSRSEVTKEVAVKALKSIERSSKIKAFLIKPVVIIASGFALLGLGFTAAMLSPLALPLVALVIAIRIAGIALSCLGLCMSAIGLEDFRHLSQSSYEYKWQADMARQLRLSLENPSREFIIRSQGG